MTTIHRHICPALFALCAVVTSAHAEYRCDGVPTRTDARACQAAEEGPAQLRRFIERMRGIEDLEFANYVNRSTVLAWERKEAEELVALREQKAPRSSVVRSEQR
jgi:hypothetical protein